MKNYNKKTILITGGAGFIGCHLVNQLDKDKYNIVILDRLVNNIELKQNRLNKFLNPADYIFYNTELDNVKKIKKIGLRFFTTYGPWGRPDMAISKFTEQIYRGEPITIHNHGKIRKDFSYITDTVSGIISAIETNLNFEIINLGSGTSTEIQKVIELIENNLEKTAKKEYIDMHFGDLPETRANIEKAKKLLNYKPKINIEEGIKRYIDWYKKYIIIIK